MAYTPKTWQCNDTITADELNRMEQGIADASQSGGGTSEVLTVTKVLTYVEEAQESFFFPESDATVQELLALEGKIFTLRVMEKLSDNEESQEILFAPATVYITPNTIYVSTVPQIQYDPGISGMVIASAGYQFDISGETVSSITAIQHRV